MAGTALVTGATIGLLGAWYGATHGRWGWSRVDLATARVGVRPLGGGTGLAMSVAFR